MRDIFFILWTYYYFEFELEKGILRAVKKQVKKTDIEVIRKAGERLIGGDAGKAYATFFADKMITNI